MKAYMLVSQDKYSLPLAIADSPRQLERMLGLRRGTVNRYLSRGREYKTPRYVRVEIDWSDEDEQGCVDWQPDGQAAEPSD